MDSHRNPLQGVFGALAAVREQDCFPSCLEAVCLFAAGGSTHGGVPGVTASPMAVLLDHVHWGGRVPSRQLHSCSRAALATPAEAAHGEVPALARCCPKARQGQLCRAVCQSWLSAAAAVGLGAREDDAEGEGGRKSSL